MEVDAVGETRKMGDSLLVNLEVRDVGCDGAKTEEAMGYRITTDSKANDRWGKWDVPISQ
jgi:hypothetical protein